MESSSHLSEHLKNKENFKQFHQETLLLEVASLIHKTLQERGITRAELAERLGVSKGRISQYLGGERNLRLRTLADIFTALDCKVAVKAGDFCREAGWHVVGSQEVQLAKRAWNLAECLKTDGDTLQLAG